MSAIRVAVPGYDTARIAKISLPSLRQRTHAAAIGMDHRWQQSFVLAKPNERSQWLWLRRLTAQMPRSAFPPFLFRHSIAPSDAT
jgi:hypothetical protein